MSQMAPQHSASQAAAPQSRRHEAGRRATLVVVLTFFTMLAEIITGCLTGSMALLADGIQMAGHTLALGLATLAYFLSRRQVQNRRLSPGSGKAADLAAYTGALLLTISTLWLVYASIQRLQTPTELMSREALIMAALGLGVNLLSAFLLTGRRPQQKPDEDEQGINISVALVHVIADTLTSLAAIIGLAAAWLWGLSWVDPLVALVAAAVILYWACGLIRQAGSVLLDREGPSQISNAVRKLLQRNGDTDIVDLHVWSVGQGSWTLVASVIAHGPTTVEEYTHSLKPVKNLHHPIIEVSYCSKCARHRHDH